MSEIERLKELIEDTKELSDNLSQGLDNIIDSVDELEDAEPDTIYDDSWPVCTTMEEERKRDFINENWEKITLKNLEAIV